MLNTRETLITAPDFDDSRIACIRAAESARRCVKETCSIDALDQCRSSCEDTATVLEALIEMLERPYASSRAVSLRRMIEAGLATSVECAAECNEYADEAPACVQCAADCERASMGLRQLLREFAHHDVAERSGAT